MASPKDGEDEEDNGQYAAWAQRVQGLDKVVPKLRKRAGEYAEAAKNAQTGLLALALALRAFVPPAGAAGSGSQVVAALERAAHDLEAGTQTLVQRVRARVMGARPTAKQKLACCEPLGSPPTGPAAPLESLGTHFGPVLKLMEKRDVKFLDVGIGRRKPKAATGVGGALG